MCQFEKNGRPVPVADHWCNKWRDRTGQRRPLNHSNLRTIKVKAFRGFIEIPPEFCQLMPGQKPKVSYCWSLVLISENENSIQGCWVNAYDANLYDLAYSYGFLGESFNLLILTFSNLFLNSNT